MDAATLAVAVYPQPEGVIGLLGSDANAAPLNPQQVFVAATRGRFQGVRLPQQRTQRPPSFCQALHAEAVSALLTPQHPFRVCSPGFAPVAPLGRPAESSEAPQDSARKEIPSRPDGRSSLVKTPPSLLWFNRQIQSTIGL